jgi:hypothetical protein
MDQMIVRRDGLKTQVASGLHVGRQPFQGKALKAKIYNRKMRAVIHVRLSLLVVGLCLYPLLFDPKLAQGFHSFQPFNANNRT